MSARSARRGLSTAVLVAAGLALTACGPSDTTPSASKPSASVPSATASATAPGAASSPASSATPGAASSPASSAAPGSATASGVSSPTSTGLDCGSGWNGLTVEVPGPSTAISCARALEITDAFGKALDAGSKPPVTVTVDGAAWRCQERQGGINPYEECAYTANPAQTVRLVS